MYSKYLFGLAFIIIVIFSCKNKNITTNSNIVIADTANYFDLNGYIQGQINEVLETPYYIYKLTNSNNKKDSTAITKKEFAQWASMLLTTSINDSINKQYYKETSFGDYANNTITLNYTCTNDTLPVQQISIIISEESKQVQRIFISQWQKNEAQDYELKMALKANESFMINKTITHKNGDTYKELNTIVWNKATANL